MMDYESTRGSKSAHSHGHSHGAGGAESLFREAFGGGGGDDDDDEPAHGQRVECNTH